MQTLSRQMLNAVAFVAPGTSLREGLDRIQQSGFGGLIVLSTREAERLYSGGFVIETELTAQRLSELSKMDGAIVLDATARRVLRANVHLVPDASAMTNETGTRHRTAERVARLTDATVIAVSKRMSLISIYSGHEKHILQPVQRGLALANQAVATLERYRGRFDAVATALSALEVEDLVTLRDVLVVLQRGQMVRRIGEEADVLLAELGTEGRLLRLQVDELSAGVDRELGLVIRDFVGVDSDEASTEAVRLLCDMATEELADLYYLMPVIRPAGTSIDTTLGSRGYRFLSRIPRIPSDLVGRIVGYFDGLQKVLNASLLELEEIDGVGDVRALQIKEGLARLAEASILDRYG